MKTLSILYGCDDSLGTTFAFLKLFFATKQVINHVTGTSFRKCWITQASLSLCKYYANKAELVILDAALLFIANKGMKRQNASAASCYMEGDRTVATHDWWGNPSLGLSVQSSCVESFHTSKPTSQLFSFLFLPFIFCLLHFPWANKHSDPDAIVFIKLWKSVI